MIKMNKIKIYKKNLNLNQNLLKKFKKFNQNKNQKVKNQILIDLNLQKIKSQIFKMFIKYVIKMK